MTRLTLEIRETQTMAWARDDPDPERDPNGRRLGVSIWKNVAPDVDLVH